MQRLVNIVISVLMMPKRIDLSVVLQLQQPRLPLHLTIVITVWKVHLLHHLLGIHLGLMMNVKRTTKICLDHRVPIIIINIPNDNDHPLLVLRHLNYINIRNANVRDKRSIMLTMSRSFILQLQLHLHHHQPWRMSLSNSIVHLVINIINLILIIVLCKAKDFQRLAPPITILFHLIHVPYRPFLDIVLEQRTIF